MSTNSVVVVFTLAWTTLFSVWGFTELTLRTTSTMVTRKPSRHYKGFRSQHQQPLRVGRNKISSSCHIRTRSEPDSSNSAFSDSTWSEVLAVSNAIFAKRQEIKDGERQLKEQSAGRSPPETTVTTTTSTTTMTMLSRAFVTGSSASNASCTTGRGPLVLPTLRTGRGITRRRRVWVRRSVCPKRCREAGWILLRLAQSIAPWSDATTSSAPFSIEKRHRLVFLDLLTKTPPLRRRLVSGPGLPAPVLGEGESLVRAFRVVRCLRRPF